MGKNKATIMVVTGGYFPGTEFGGIATSRFNFSEALGDEFDIAIVTRDHDYKTTERYESIHDGWNAYGKAKVFYCSDETFCEATFTKLIDEIKPDLMYASGTITSYFYHNKGAFAAAKKANVPILLTPDGDVRRSAMHTKMLKKMGAALFCRLTNAFKDVWFQPTCLEEAVNLPRYLGIKKDKITLLPNLPHIFPPRENYVKEQGKIKVVFTGRIHPIKNLRFVIETICTLKAPATLDIFGALEDKPYWDSCEKLIAEAPPHVKIQYKGNLRANEARQIAKNYDCYFLPTLTENYGYTIEEALLSGCPAVISLGTTPWDDLDGVAGRAIPLEKRSEFSAELEKIAGMNATEYENYCCGIKGYIEKKLSYESLCAQYKQLIYKIISTKND